jgi:hypothetical protein
VFLLEWSEDGAEWLPEPPADEYYPLLRRATAECPRRRAHARISNLALAVLLVHVGPDGLPQGVADGTVS